MIEEANDRNRLSGISYTDMSKVRLFSSVIEVDKKSGFTNKDFSKTLTHSDVKFLLAGGSTVNISQADANKRQSRMLGEFIPKLNTKDVQRLTVNVYKDEVDNLSE